MRDHIQVAQRILASLSQTRGSSTRKREFMQQMQNFIKDTKYYPSEARYPWDKLGHLCREYCSTIGQCKMFDWQKITLEIINGGKAMKKLLLVILVLLFSATAAIAADIHLKWDPANNATGYKLYISTDSGQTWDQGTDVGNVTEYVLTVPDHQLVLIRASAYNSYGESVRTDAGVFYNSDWVKPDAPSRTGIQ